MGSTGARGRLPAFGIGKPPSAYLEPFGRRDFSRLEHNGIRLLRYLTDGLESAVRAPREMLVAPGANRRIDEQRELLADRNVCKTATAVTPYHVDSTTTRA